MTVLPLSDTRSAAAGIVTLADGPAATMRPFCTTMVALSIGARSVPSKRRAPVKARAEEGAWAWVTATSTVRATATDAAMMDLMMELEERFDVSIPLNLLPEVRTVGDLVNTVRQLKGNA